MIKGIFKYRLNRQIIYIFLIINFLLIVSVFFTYRTIQRYEEEISYIDETSLQQLLHINKILHNAGIRRQTLLIYLFSQDSRKQQLYIDVLENLQKENENFFRLLNEAIKKEHLKSYINELLVHRKAYSEKIEDAIALKKAGELINPLDYEQTELESFYNTYTNYLEQLSGMLAENADENIAETLEELKQLRRIHTIIMILGSLILLAMIIGVLLIITKLRNDFITLEKETAERKQAEKRLRLVNKELEIKSLELNKLNQHKDKFISVISHDLRNPLSSIIGSSSFLADHPDKIEKDDTQRMVQIINRSARKLLQQLNELVTLARTSDTKHLFNPVILNLSDEVNHDIKFLWDIIEKKNIHMENKIKEDLKIEADRLMLRSILQNILTNAVKYTGKGGKIVISSTIDKDVVEITVRDSGIGMKEEERHKLFSEKVVSKQGTEEEKGTGMGLKLVKDFVERHGGRLKIDSKEGKGTAVSFTLPAAPLYANP